MDRATVSHKRLRALFIFLSAFAYLLAFSLHWPPAKDAAHYLYAAQSFCAGNGFLLDPASSQATTPYMVLWPPLQSITTAGLLALDLPPHTAIRLLNAACYALTVVLVNRSLARWRWPLTLALFTPAFFEPYLWAMSEPLFTLLLTAFLLLLLREPLPLAALSMVATALVMQRYSGVVVVAFGVLYIVFVRPQSRVRMAVE